MPAVKPAPWTGVLDTVEWAPEAPQGPHTEIPEVAATIPKTGVSEDCLRLNVWTTSLNRNASRTLPGGPFSPTAPEISSDIPVLIGSTEYEITFFPNTKYDPLDDAALKAAFKTATQASGADVDRLIGVYKKGRPGLSNLDYSIIMASDNFRARVITQTERKAAQKAPVYFYYFTWQSPVRNGLLKSFHTVEIPFVMANVDEGKQWLAAVRIGTRCRTG